MIILAFSVTFCCSIFINEKMLAKVLKSNVFHQRSTSVSVVLLHSKSPRPEADSEMASQPTALSPSESQQQRLLLTQPVQPADPKRLRVSVIGWPNAGKSTLINALTHTHVLPMSAKIDTTTRNTLAIFTSGDTQIEFLDSPGIHNRSKSKKHVGSYLNARQPSRCMENSDLCLVIADLSSRTVSRGKLQPEVLLHLLRHRDVPAILVLNKVDRLSNRLAPLKAISSLTAGFVDGVSSAPVENKPLEPIWLPRIKSGVLKAFEEIKNVEHPNDISLASKDEPKALAQLRKLRGWPYFKDVFVISSLQDHHVDQLRNYLLLKAKPGEWKYNQQLITDQSPYESAKDAIRSALLENLDEEVPYLVDVHILDWRVHTDHIVTEVELRCQKKKHVKYCEGRAATLSFAVRRRLSILFGMDVKLHMVAYVSR